MTLRRRAAYGVLWSAVEFSGRQVIALATFVVLARLLDPSDFGLLALAMMVVALGETLISESVLEGLIQRSTVTEGHSDAAFWAVLLGSCGLTVVMILIAPLVAQMFREPGVTPLLRMLSPFIVLTALAAVPNALLRRQMKFNVIAVRTAISMTVGGVVGITLAFLGYGVWSLVWQQLAMRATDVLVVWTAMRWRPGRRGRWRDIRDLWRYAAVMFGWRLTEFLDIRASGFFIGLLLGPVALGYYSLATRLLDSLARILVNPFNRVAFPVFSRVRGNAAMVDEVLDKTSRFGLVFALPSFTGMGLVAPELIPLAFGSKWAPAVPLVQVLALTAFAVSVTGNRSTLVRGLGRPEWQFYITIVGLVANVGLLIALTPNGVIWVGYARFIKMYVFLLPLFLAAAYALTRQPLARQARPWIAGLAGSTVMALAVQACRVGLADVLEPLPLLAISIATGVIVYSGYLLAFHRDLFTEMVSQVRRRSP